MPREKVKFALRIRPETQQLVKDLCPKANCQTQNELIEKAIYFFAGYLATEDAADFLPPLYSSALRGIVHDSENRTCRLLFKLAVEIDMMMNVLAAGLEIDSTQLDALRWRCVQEVKKVNGTISFKDTLKKNQDEE